MRRRGPSTIHLYLEELAGDYSRGSERLGKDRNAYMLSDTDEKARWARY